MGNCLTSVHVTGSHHNSRRDDTDQIAAKFADELKAKGHNVTAATLVVCGEYDLLNEASHFPLKEAA